MRVFYTKVGTFSLNVFLGCILFLVFACGKEEYMPKKFMGLKGKVASIRDTVYDCTLGGFYSGSGELWEVETIDFDSEGNVVKTHKHNADSSVVCWKEFIYKDNVLFSYNERMCVGEDVFNNTSERIGIENGTIKYKESNGSQQWISEVKTAGKYRLEYSEGEYGHTKNEIWADRDNNVIKTKYLLVSNDVTFANGTNTLEKVSTMKYDKEGSISETVHIEGKDTSVTVYSYHRYDKNGNWTEQQLETNGYFKQRVKRTIEYREY